MATPKSTKKMQVAMEGLEKQMMDKKDKIGGERLWME